ncbi:hypothetical protein DSY14_21060 [Nocardiopsis sp. MG754419]|nr:hypothetical protein [Nocardiopsis sp. MG754419]
MTLALTTALALGAGPAVAATTPSPETRAEVPTDPGTAVRVDAPGRSEARTDRESHSPRLYYSTWRDAHSYWSADTRYPSGGRLWAGRHGFFCQVEGQAHSDGEGGYSTWWALTDDQTGNRDVYVSATAFRIAEPWRPIEGLPQC